MPAAGPAGGGATHQAAANAGAGAALPGASSAAPAISGPISGEQAVRIFENVVLPLANPSADPAGKFIEVTVACMLWLDDTGLRTAKSDGNAALRDLCQAMVRNAPQLAERAITAKFMAPAVPGNARSGTRSASLER